MRIQCLGRSNGSTISDFSSTGNTRPAPNCGIPRARMSRMWFGILRDDIGALFVRIMLGIVQRHPDDGALWRGLQHEAAEDFDHAHSGVNVSISGPPVTFSLVKISWNTSAGGSSSQYAKSSVAPWKRSRPCEYDLSCIVLGPPVLPHFTRMVSTRSGVPRAGTISSSASF